MTKYYTLTRVKEGNLISFDEISGRKVVTVNNLEVEISHMVGISSLQIKSLNDTQGIKIDGVRVISRKCGCCYWEY